MGHYQLTRPNKVKTATELLYITLVIGVLLSIIAVPIQVIFFSILFYGILWLLYSMIGKGHNWARIIFFVLGPLGALFFVKPMLFSGPKIKYSRLTSAREATGIIEGKRYISPGQ